MEKHPKRRRGEKFVFRAQAAEPGTAPIAQGYLARIAENNVAPTTEVFAPFRFEGTDVGNISVVFAKQLQRFPRVFVVDFPSAITMNPALQSPEERSDAAAGVLKELASEGVVTGWRDELYPVLKGFGSPPLLCVERAAAQLFGITAYGVHVNGYVTLPNGEKELWVARRSSTKPTWPGLLDHIVAGGQPHGISPTANVAKECSEEANIPQDLAETAVAVGAVSYKGVTEGNLKGDVLFCYDLHLPLDFTPENMDGEVDEFMRLPLSEVAELIQTTQDFKPNVNLVIIDFLVRHGFIRPEEPDYLQIVASLRSGVCA
ncbi:hypothetical protein CYMTET_7033 [Cymbomonas tetramitiformis]|uniref:Nudix hydrolase domain-containing protein n=1 Tax=Cymbomonas tetramitiformis TaxID=36881 RepID=A0AAE0LHH1_9CHLO|nr:hypothetical protein CYMTET_7033 [Cymbomonas tetramitiformis]|eukprot:gene16765-19916_t